MAVDANGDVVLERQYRAALDANLLEIPAGKRDVADEPPEEAARRELVEETGLQAARWSELGTFYNSPGFADEHSTLFLAQDLVDVDHDKQGPEEEAMEIVRDEAPAVPVSYGTSFSLVRDGLLGASQNGLGILRLAGLEWAKGQ